MNGSAWIVCLLGAVSLGVVTAQAYAQPAPLIVGHRGAAGERPEHTAAGYRLAIEEGADYIEPDLVLTKDGVLIARHENEIGATTDVAGHPEFAARKTTKIVDGHSVTGWFSEDFTLAEIKTLRARERLPQLRPGNTAYDGRDEVLTFAEVIDLALSEGRRAGRVVGVYAELKHPTYFASLGLPMEARLVAVLKEKGLADRRAAFFFECFEPGALQKVRAMIDVRTILLMDSEGAPADFTAAGDKRTYADLATPAELKAVAAYADGIGPSKTMLIARDAKDGTAAATTLVADAHAAGLLVHPFTFRSENVFLPAELRRGDPQAPGYQAVQGDWRAEYQMFFALGVDGLFSDFPDAAVEARRAFMKAAPVAAGASGTYKTYPLPPRMVFATLSSGF